MEQQYLDLLKDILENGEDRSDRTGVGTRSVFGRQIRCNLKDGFPAITTKKLFFKPCVAELLWFLEGSSDERRLAEIQHGSRDTEKTTIWSGNANAPYWKPKAKFAGDLGRVYGVQWRNWVHTELISSSDNLSHESGAMTYFNSKVRVKSIDQIANIINTIKTIPGDRRMILTAFNVGEMDQMALPPCHLFCQFYVGNLNNGKPKTLSCQLYMRSSDTLLGMPFNIASYALLTHMMAQVTGLEVGELVMTFGDTHIYQNHMDQVKEQLSRSPLPLPSLKLNPEIKDIGKFTMADIELVGYQSHPAIKAPMAV